MKLLLLAVSVLSSFTLVSGNVGTCELQAPCLSVTITKVEGSCSDNTCESGDNCVYEICWTQISGGECTKGEDKISHFGDAATDGANCLRPADENGFVVWDDQCDEEPGFPYQNCQLAKPGEISYLIVKDADSCSTSQTGITITSTGEFTQTASCSPTSTGDGTYNGGTCTGKGVGEGDECVWSIQAPDAADCGCPTPAPSDPPSGSNGDPHFKTWKNEHFEYHGQCDLVLAKDETFADDIGLDVQIRTKVVRYWSYIKNAAIRIGNDILEVEGGPETDATNHYWYNLEYQGKMETLGGFPVTYHQRGGIKRTFEIDLSSKYPGQKIVIATYKEFVRVDFVDGTEEAYGKTKGLLGDFKTGHTLARDGTTILNDFWEYGNEWQVLPFENMLFHEVSDPQFPERCIEPEDPRGERRRKLSEATVTEAQAEAACAHLKDPLDRKDCLYDILATQDLDMVGAY